MIVISNGNGKGRVIVSTTIQIQLGLNLAEKIVRHLKAVGNSVDAEMLTFVGRLGEATAKARCFQQQVEDAGGRDVEGGEP